MKTLLTIFLRYFFIFGLIFASYGLARLRAGVIPDFLFFGALGAFLIIIGAKFIKK